METANAYNDNNPNYDSNEDDSSRRSSMFSVATTTNASFYSAFTSEEHQPDDGDSTEEYNEQYLLSLSPNKNEKNDGEEYTSSSDDDDNDDDYDDDNNRMISYIMNTALASASNTTKQQMTQYMLEKMILMNNNEETSIDGRAKEIKKCEEEQEDENNDNVVTSVSNDEIELAMMNKDDEYGEFLAKNGNGDDNVIDKESSNRGTASNNDGIEVTLSSHNFGSASYKQHQQQGNISDSITINIGNKYNRNIPINTFSDENGDDSKNDEKHKSILKQHFMGNMNLVPLHLSTISTTSQFHSSFPRITTHHHFMIHIVQAFNLQNVDEFGLLHPYCTITLFQFSSARKTIKRQIKRRRRKRKKKDVIVMKRRTQVVWNNVNPIWNRSFDCIIPSSSSGMHGICNNDEIILEISIKNFNSDCYVMNQNGGQQDNNEAINDLSNNYSHKEEDDDDLGCIYLPLSTYFPNAGNDDDEKQQNEEKKVELLLPIPNSNDDIQNADNDAAVSTSPPATLLIRIQHEYVQQHPTIQNDIITAEGMEQTSNKSPPTSVLSMEQAAQEQYIRNYSASQSHENLPDEKESSPPSSSSEKVTQKEYTPHNPVSKAKDSLSLDQEEQDIEDNNCESRKERTEEGEREDVQWSNGYDTSQHSSIQSSSLCLKEYSQQQQREDLGSSKALDADKRTSSKHSNNDNEDTEKSSSWVEEQQQQNMSECHLKESNDSHVSNGGNKRDATLLLAPKQQYYQHNINAIQQSVPQSEKQQREQSPSPTVIQQRQEQQQHCKEQEGNIISESYLAEEEEFCAFVQENQSASSQVKELKEEDEKDKRAIFLQKQKPYKSATALLLPPAANPPYLTSVHNVSNTNTNRTVFLDQTGQIMKNASIDHNKTKAVTEDDEVVAIEDREECHDDQISNLASFSPNKNEDIHSKESPQKQIDRGLVVEYSQCQPTQQLHLDNYYDRNKSLYSAVYHQQQQHLRQQEVKQEQDEVANAEDNDERQESIVDQSFVLGRVQWREEGAKQPITTRQNRNYKEGLKLSEEDYYRSVKENTTKDETPSFKQGMLQSKPTVEEVIGEYSASSITVERKQGQSPRDGTAEVAIGIEESLPARRQHDHNLEKNQSLKVISERSQKERKEMVRNISSFESETNGYNDKNDLFASGCDNHPANDCIVSDKGGSTNDAEHDQHHLHEKDNDELNDDAIQINEDKENYSDCSLFTERHQPYEANDVDNNNDASGENAHKYVSGDHADSNASNYGHDKDGNFNNEVGKGARENRSFIVDHHHLTEKRNQSSENTYSAGRNMKDHSDFPDVENGNCRDSSLSNDYLRSEKEDVDSKADIDDGGANLNKEKHGDHSVFVDDQLFCNEDHVVKTVYNNNDEVEKGECHPLLLCRPFDKRRRTAMTEAENFNTESSLEEKAANNEAKESLLYFKAGIAERVFSCRLVTPMISVLLLVPLVLILLGGPKRFCPLIGRRRYGTFTALIPLSATLAGNKALANFVDAMDEEPDSIVSYMLAESFITLPIAVVVGVIMCLFGFVSSGFDVMFGLIIGVAQVATVIIASIIGMLAPILFNAVLGEDFTESYGEGIISVIQDSIGLSFMVEFSYWLFSIHPLVSVPDDMCI